MNTSGIGVLKVQSIEQMLDTMPEPEHSNQKGLDNRKWEPLRTKVKYYEPGEGFDEVFKAATGDDYEEACFFYSSEGRKARGKQ